MKRFHLLTERSLEFIIPKAGPRCEFLEKFKEYKEQTAKQLEVSFS
jgi:hypothetical protein